MKPMPVTSKEFYAPHFVSITQGALRVFPEFHPPLGSGFAPMTPKDPLWDVLLEVDFRVLEKDGYEPQVRGGDVVVLAHLHCLPSIVRLFYILLTQDLSVPAKQVILIPKPYSTIASAADDVRKLGISIIRTDGQFRLGRYDEAVSSHLKEGCRKAHHICCDIVKRAESLALFW